MRITKIHLILLLTLLLAGCAPAAAADAPTAQPSATASQTAVPTCTASQTATLTPIPPTATLSSTPTLSPTITMTPLPFNACPVTDEEYQYPFAEVGIFTKELSGQILEALNNGITFTNLKESIDQVICGVCLGGERNGEVVPTRYENAISARDLTGDEVEEILFIDFGALNIFTCKQGNYVMPLSMNNFFGRNDDVYILDLNNNATADILMHTYTDPMHGPRPLYIFEWDGEIFHNLILLNENYQNSLYPKTLVTDICTRISDFNPGKDGTIEIVLRGTPCDFGEVSYTGPYRYYSITLTWDGNFFQIGDYVLDPPTYLFQAVQDGDRETLRGNYDKALDYYDQALNDPNLKGWSQELYRQQWDSMQARYSEQPTPTPAPVDPNEKETLTAYVHYRKMLIYTVQGKPEEALAEYMTVMKLTPGQPGYAYKGLAITFWKKYQNTHDLAAVCIVTREYANERDEELYDPIDDRWHGWQSPGHSSDLSMGKVICPFE